MKNAEKIIFLLVVGIFLLSACSQQNVVGQGSNAPVTPAQSGDVVGQGSAVNEQPTTPKQNDDFKEFKITAKQFQFEPSAIEVNKGDKVRLIVTSVDVPHGIAISEYGINERLDVGKPKTIEFTADKQGTFTAFCSVFCGSGHSNMKGKLIVK